MKTSYVSNAALDAQKGMYESLNKFSESHSILGRLGAVPVAILDVGVDILARPLAAIECVALFAINLFGAAFSSKCTLKDAICSLELTGFVIAGTFIGVGMAPLKCLYQFFAILIDPCTVQSINYRNPTFKA